MGLYELNDLALLLMSLTKAIGFLLMLNVLFLPVMIIGRIIEKKQKERKGTPITNEDFMIYSIALIRVTAFAILGFCLLNLSDHSYSEIIEVLLTRYPV